MAYPTEDQIGIYAALNADNEIINVFWNYEGVEQDNTPGAVSYGFLTAIVADYDEVATVLDPPSEGQRDGDT